jgi:hypothetical protein
MTKDTFLKAKINSYKPEFKKLIGLTESNKTSELLDFMTMLHPNQCKQAQGSKGEVFSKNHYLFTIYTNCIVRTNVETGIKRLYPLN